MVHLVYDCRNKSTNNLEPLQHSDANGIVVYPLQAINYCPWFSHTQKGFNRYYSYGTVFIIRLWVVHLVYDSRIKSTSNLEPLQHSDANGSIVHPSKVLIIFDDCYTLRKALIAIIATVEFFKIPLWVVHLVYDSRNKSTSNLELLQHSDANGIVVHPCKLLITVLDFYTLRKALIAIIATVQFL